MYTEKNPTNARVKEDGESRRPEKWLRAADRRVRLDGLEKFRLPVVVKTKREVYVSFYVLSPDSILEGRPRLVRIRHRFNHVKPARERMAAAIRFREEVSAKLKEGWNPLVDDSMKVAFKPLGEVIERYRVYLLKEMKDGVLRETSVEHHLGRARMLERYNGEEAERPVLYVYQLDRSYMENFLDHLYLNRGVNARTRNNYLVWLRTFCDWLCGRGYLATNPAMSISKLREAEKQRKPLASGAMERLREYLAETDPFFLLACSFHYYTLVRPREMSFIRLRDISIHEQTLFVSGEVSKNHKDAVVTLPATLIMQLLDLRVFDFPDSYFLFGRGFVPCAERCSEKMFRDRWAKVRRELKFPASYKFYSLKDTGVTDYVDGVGLTAAKDQARHSSVATTNKYVRKQQLRAQPELKNWKGQL